MTAEHPAVGWRAGVLSLALFLALAVGHTWPLAAGPETYHRHDNMDTQLNEWTLAWVGHQVVRNPLRVFDAPIFHPERHTLAFSEHLLVQGVMALPLRWLGLSPVGAFNLMVVVGLALSGWTTALVMRRWTGSWMAGILSGCLLAFNANTLTRLVHIQALHLQFFPLMLLALDQVLSRPTVRAAARLAVWFVLQSLTSVYFMVFITIAAAAGVAARPAAWLRDRWRATLGHLALAGGLAALLLGPAIAPYLLARQEQEGFTRSIQEVAQFSASWPNYLAAAGTLHRDVLGWSQGYATADFLFPGVMALAVILVALVTGTAFREPRARMALAFGVVSFALSFGPAFPLYTWLYETFTPLQAIRGAARFGQMALAGAALVAGFGLAWMTSRLPRKAALVVGCVVIAVANAEAWRAPIAYCGTPQQGRCGPLTGLAPIFKTLDRPDVQALVVLPFYGPGGDVLQNARYMLQGTQHFKPMLNGYSGYAPMSMARHREALADFPGDRALLYLRDLGVTHIVIEERSVSGELLDAASQSPALRVEAAGDGYRVLALR